MDFYYDEQQMNKWRDSCIRTQDSFKMKVEKFDKDFAQIRAKYLEHLTTLTCEDGKQLYKRLEAITTEKDPLLLSIVSTVYEDLKELHKYLNVFCGVMPSDGEVR